MQRVEEEFKKIELSLPEFASLVEKISPFIPEDFESVGDLVKKALSLDKIPEEEKINFSPLVKTIENVIDRYWETSEESDEEKSSIRQGIKMSSNEDELVWVHGEIMGAVLPESFEAVLFIRKMATLCFVGSVVEV